MAVIRDQNLFRAITHWDSPKCFYGMIETPTKKILQIFDIDDWMVADETL